MIKWAGSVLFALLLLLSGCVGTEFKPSVQASTQINGVWFNAVPASTRLDQMPAGTFGFMDIGTTYVNPEAINGVFQWAVLDETYLAATSNNIQSVRVSFDGQSHVVDAAAACAQAKKEDVNFKKHWTSSKWKINDPKLTLVLATGDNCTPDMPSN